MKNLKKLGLIFSVGTIAAFSFSLAACGDDDDSSSGGTGGSTAGTPATGGGGSGAGTPATGGAGAGTGGSSAGTPATGGGGAATGGGGAATGGGGAGGGGAGGGGAGGGGAGGGGGGGGGAPSADCAKWCSGANGVVMFCAGAGLADAVNTEPKCIAHCTAAEAAGDKGLSCWNTHLTNAINNKDDAAMKMLHCKHASGAPGNGVCNETK